MVEARRKSYHQHTGITERARERESAVWQAATAAEGERPAIADDFRDDHLDVLRSRSCEDAAGATRVETTGVVVGAMYLPCRRQIQRCREVLEAATTEDSGFAVLIFYLRGALYVTFRFRQPRWWRRRGEPETS